MAQPCGALRIESHLGRRTGAAAGQGDSGPGCFKSNSKTGAATAQAMAPQEPTALLRRVPGPRDRISAEAGRPAARRAARRAAPSLRACRAQESTVRMNLRARAGVPRSARRRRRGRKGHQGLLEPHVGRGRAERCASGVAAFGFSKAVTPSLRVSFGDPADPAA